MTQAPRRPAGRWAPAIETERVVEAMSIVVTDREILDTLDQARQVMRFVLQMFCCWLFLGSR